MRLNMHRETPEAVKVSEKAEMTLLTTAFGLLGAPCLCAAAALTYGGAVGAGVMMLLMAALVCLAGAQSFAWEKRSYVEICGEEITAVEYVWCRPNTSRFQKSQIGSASYSAVRHGKISVRYIRLNDRQGQKLLEIYCCPESEKIIEALIEEKIG